MVIALVPVVLLIVAVAYLVLAWGPLVKVFQFIADHLKDLPGVGGMFHDAFTGMGSAFAEWLLSWVGPAVKPFTDMIDYVSGSIQFWARSVGEAIGSAVFGLRTLAARVASDWGYVISQISRIVSQITAQAGQIATAAARIVALGATVATIIAVRIPAAVSQAIAAAEAWAGARIAAVAASLQAAIARAVAVAQALVSAEQAARAAGDAAVRAAAAAEAALLARQLSTAVATLDRTIATDIGQIGQAIEGIQTKIGPIPWATVAIGLTTIATEISTLRRVCVDPTCNYLGPQLGALTLAEDALMLAAVAELVAAAAQNPEQAARDTIATTTPFVGMVRGLLGELTGLQV